MSECYVSHSLADAVADIKEMNVPAKMIPELLAHIMLESLQKSETEQELSMKLIDDLRSDGIISADQFIKVNFQLKTIFRFEGKVFTEYLQLNPS